MVLRRRETYLKNVWIVTQGKVWFLPAKLRKYTHIGCLQVFVVGVKTRSARKLFGIGYIFWGVQRLVELVSVSLPSIIM